MHSCTSSIESLTCTGFQITRPVKGCIGAILCPDVIMSDQLTLIRVFFYADDNDGEQRHATMCMRKSRVESSEQSRRDTEPAEAVESELRRSPSYRVPIDSSRLFISLPRD